MVRVTCMLSTKMFPGGAPSFSTPFIYSMPTAPMRIVTEEPLFCPSKWIVMIGTVAFGLLTSSCSSSLSSDSTAYRGEVLSGRGSISWNSSLVKNRERRRRKIDTILLSRRTRIQMNLTAESTDYESFTYNKRPIKTTLNPTMITRI